MCKQDLPNKIEILSPAGDFESVKAAVQNGANAVYLGGKSFSARQSAKNFNEEDLSFVVSYCHARAVLVYLTLNTLVFDSQVNQMIDTIKNAVSIGVDALIVQDLAVFSLAKQICPKMPLHASTQMSITTLEGASQLAKMGFSRVVLARELSFEQIRIIAEAKVIETEVFVHGALCMSVSGQCYISGMLMERSGNRGSCAGICRLPFSSTKNESYDLSLKDLCLTKQAKQLMEAGVTSIKIEGRMKRPEYVAATTGAYHNALLELPYDTESLKAVFSRSGFTDGYFENGNPRDMFGYRQKEDVTAATSALLKSFANTYHKEKGQVTLNMSFCAEKGKETLLVGYDGATPRHQAQVTGDMPQTAINRATTAEEVVANLSKLGGTEYIPGIVECDIDEGLMLPASQINGMRRLLCELITKESTKVIPRDIFEPEIISPRADKASLSKGYIARYQNMEQVEPERLDSLSYFSLPLSEIKQNLSALLPYKDKLSVELPRGVFEQAEEEAVKELLTELKADEITCITATNMAHIRIANELELSMLGSCFLNCLNSYSVEVLAKSGVKMQEVSFEASLNDAIRINSDIPLSIICYGYLPLMLLKTCPMKNQLDCSTCTKLLTDRKGKSFPLFCNNKKSTELLNCNPLYMGDRMSELDAFTYKTFYFTTETKSECEKVFEDYSNALTPPAEFTRGLYYRSI